MMFAGSATNKGVASSKWRPPRKDREMKKRDATPSFPKSTRERVASTHSQWWSAACSSTRLFLESMGPPTSSCTSALVGNSSFASASAGNSGVLVVVLVGSGGGASADSTLRCRPTAVTAQVAWVVYTNFF